MNKAKELLNKLKEFVSLHKVVCLSAAGAVCAVAVTGIVVAVVLGNHSKADTVAGVETAQEETMQTMLQLKKLQRKLQHRLRRKRKQKQM